MLLLLAIFTSFTLIEFSKGDNIFQLFDNQEIPYPFLRLLTKVHHLCLLLNWNSLLYFLLLKFFAFEMFLEGVIRIPVLQGQKNS